VRVGRSCPGRSWRRSPSDGLDARRGRSCARGNAAKRRSPRIVFFPGSGSPAPPPHPPVGPTPRSVGRDPPSWRRRFNPGLLPGPCPARRFTSRRPRPTTSDRDPVGVHAPCCADRPCPPWQHPGMSSNGTPSSSAHDLPTRPSHGPGPCADEPVIAFHPLPGGGACGWEGRTPTRRLAVPQASRARGDGAQGPHISVYVETPRPRADRPHWARVSVSRLFSFLSSS